MLFRSDEVLEDARLVDELEIDSTSFYSLQLFEKSQLAKTVSHDYYDVKGIKISPIPLRGPEAIRRISLAILLSDTAICLSAP